MNRKKALEMTRFEYGVSCDVQSRSIINSIYDDFESRVCENCEYWRKKTCSLQWHTVGSNSYFVRTDSAFGCNRFAKEL